MNDKSEILEKLGSYRTLTIVIAVVVVFELAMLFFAIPVKTKLIWISLGGLTIFFIYLIALCLRLIKELKDILDK